MIEDDLARALSEAYTDGYLDREGALRAFGERWREDLEALTAYGDSALIELVKDAEIGGPEYYARFIKEGMERGRPNES